MAVERFISPTAPAADALDPRLAGETERNWSLRPKKINEYVGQPELIARLLIAMGAAKKRAEPMEHVLLHGPPGLGKTTLAHIIAEEMNAKVHITSGPALAKPSDLVGTLTQLQPGDVVFIDEIHRTPVAVEEFIYPAMEDFKIDIRTEQGMHAKTIEIALKPFTLIGATTRAGMVSAPMRSRFGLTHSLRYYTAAELLVILERSCQLLETPVTGRSLEEIAARSRGTPRIANRLLRRVRDFALVKSDGTLTPGLAHQALKLEGVDQLGLDELDRAYLRVIATTYGGGPAGLEAIAATLNHDTGTLEDVVEPYLLQTGLIARTRRGRALTKAGAEHVGMPESAASGLFESDA
jgi:holliday junction DNA helicase RuvB